MANPKELRRARKLEADAIESRKQIEALPRHVGGQVRWSNDVIWTRLGDDLWEPDADPNFRYDSKHVASGNWEAI